VPEIVDMEPGMLELFNNVAGVRFFETQCIYCSRQQQQQQQQFKASSSSSSSQVHAD